MVPSPNKYAARWTGVLPVNCRAEKYLKGPARVKVPDEKVPWDYDMPDYAPVEHLDPAVRGKDGIPPVWADEIGAYKTAKFMAIDDDLDRTSGFGTYKLSDEGVPMHPLGRTGVSERGLLGRYGPNHAADPVVSRFKRSGDGGIEYDGEGRPKVEFVLIQRTDNNMWAIPGGMVDKGEAFSATLKREFAEEALAEVDPSIRSDVMAKLDAAFSAGGEMLYQGYTDDPRNTDCAWMETTAVHFHDEDGSSFGAFPLHAGDDAGQVQWALYTPTRQLYGDHRTYIDLAYNNLVAKYKKQG